ncbi:MAG: hypothetical protein ACPG4X_06220 [Pikeienuella sp.]
MDWPCRTLLGKVVSIVASFRDILSLNARPRLAVDFGADFVAVRYAPKGGEWTEIGAAPLDAPDFGDQLTELARKAGEITNGDMQAELWLPASQVVNVHLEESPRLEFSARRAAASEISEAVGVPAEHLSFDLSVSGAGGHRAACATEISTVDEARAYAAAWGFDPTVVTTRHAAAAFTRPPRFDGVAQVRAMMPFAGAAAATVVLALGIGIFSGIEDGPHEPPSVDLATVVTAPTPVQEPVSDEQATAPVPDDGTLTQVEVKAPEVSDTVIASEPEDTETLLAFSVASGTPPLSPPELEAPLTLSETPRANIGVDDAVNFAAAPAISSDLTNAVTVDQTPVDPPESVTVENAGVQDEVPEVSAKIGAAWRGGDPSSAGAVDAPAAITPTDPALAAKEAEAWGEAEKAAEVESGAEVPEGDLASAGAAFEEDDAGELLTDAGEDPSSLDEVDLAAVAPLSADQTGEQTREQTGNEINENAPNAEGDPVFGAADPSEVALLAPSGALVGGAPVPELAESDDLDDIDLGPGPGSVLTSPKPVRRPPALDMTPSDLAVLTSPVPGHRPASIKPKPKPVFAGSRTAAAPKRGKPSGPGLARAATLVDVIPLDDVSLLGTFGQGNTRRALLRMPTGQVVRVSRGDVVEGWVVGRIEELSMRITRGGEARTLPLAR